MSITLEGVASFEDQNLQWTGLWRFTKEKKSFLAYSYKVRMLFLSYYMLEHGGCDTDCFKCTL
jgi:hypothetical protein